ncbi:MAG: hypothetical protein JRJ12_14930 [Deltaproteobacteria bacterium]|nr:hypothetical protein [Deltaproteobacteria bacterium]MBW2072727.1 hypothetical protein [Deltaproteobacteria bacterium]
MSADQDTIVVRANVEMPVAALNAIVAQAKKLQRTDTADLVGEMISRFILAHDFVDFVQQTANYKERS